MKKKDIIRAGNLFLIPSEQEGYRRNYYTVDPDGGFCSCTIDKLGKFCKHMTGVYQFNGVSCLNLPPITADSRYEIARLALGNNVGNKSYYPLYTKSFENLTDYNANVSERIQFTNSTENEEENCLISQEENKNLKKWLNEELSVIVEKFEKYKCSGKVCNLYTRSSIQNGVLLLSVFKTGSVFQLMALYFNT